jgi:hypothetical protein
MNKNYEKADYNSCFSPQYAERKRLRTDKILRILTLIVVSLSFLMALLLFFKES